MSGDAASLKAARDAKVLVATARSMATLAEGRVVLELGVDLEAKVEIVQVVGIAVAGRVAEEPVEHVVTSFLKQFYLKSDFVPEEIMLPTEVEDAEEVKQWLCEKREDSVKLLNPKKGQKAKLVKMIISIISINAPAVSPVIPPILCCISFRSK